MAYRKKLTDCQKKIISSLFIKLCNKFGSQTNLAKELNISSASISQYILGRAFPNPKLCLLIEEKYGTKKERLRPDLFR